MAIRNAVVQKVNHLAVLTVDRFEGGQGVRPGRIVIHHGVLRMVLEVGDREEEIAESEPATQIENVFC